MAKEKTYLTVKTKSKTLLLDTKIKPTAEELAIIPMYIAGGYHTRYKKDEKASNIERGKNLKAMAEAKKRAEKAEAKANEAHRKLIEANTEEDKEKFIKEETEYRELAKKEWEKAETYQKLLKKKKETANPEETKTEE